MNVLVLPMMYSARKFTGISMVNSLIDVVSFVNKVRDDVYWFFGVPSSNEYLKWSEDDFTHLERVTLLPILAPDGMDRALVKDGFTGIDHPFFGPLCFKHFYEKDFLRYDAVISQYYTSQQVIRMQAEYTAKYHYMLPKVGLPAVINMLTETTLDTDLPKMKADIGENCTASSLASSTLSLVITKADLKEVRRLALKFLSPSVYRGLDVRSILPSVDLSRVPQYDRPVDRCNFFHGGTFEGKKNLGSSAEIIESLISRGLKVKFEVCTQYERVPEWYNGRESFIDIHYNVDRAEFLKRLQDGDFLVCNIEYEGTGLGFTESIASGMVPIVMKKPWNEGRFRPEYRFLCNSQREFAEAMFVCAQNPESAKRMAKEEIEYTRNLYNSEKLGREWSEILDFCLIKRNEDTVKRCESHFVMKLAKEAFESLGKDFTSADLVDMIAKKSDKMDSAKVNSFWWQVRAICYALGAKEIKKDLWRKI